MPVLRRIASRLERLGLTPLSAWEQTSPRASLLRPGLGFRFGGHWVMAEPRQVGAAAGSWD